MAVLRIILLALLVSPAAVADFVEIANTDSNGTHYPNDSRVGGSVSHTGRFVVFTGDGPDVIGGTPTTSIEVYVRDMADGTIELLSVGLGGADSNGESYDAEVNEAGDLVVFLSEASNLVPNDNNGVRDAFLRDRTAGTTTRVSLDLAGAEFVLPTTEVDISRDGTTIAYRVDGMIYWHRISTGETREIEVGGSITLSDDGDKLGYAGGLGYIVYDAATDQTEVVPFNTVDGNPLDRGISMPRLSGDGRYTAFSSEATNLVAGNTGVGSVVYRVENATGDIALVSINPDGSIAGQGSTTGRPLDISADGRYVLFVSTRDVSTSQLGNTAINAAYWHDLERSYIVGASRGYPGDMEDTVLPRLSGDGTTVVFHSNRNLLPPGAAITGSEFVYIRIIEEVDVVASVQVVESTDSAEITMMVTNNGPGVASRARIELDGEGIAVRTSSPQSTCNSSTSDSNIPYTLTCFTEPLQPNGQASFTYTVDRDETRADNLSAVVSVNEFDTDDTNDNTTATVRAKQPPAPPPPSGGGGGGGGGSTGFGILFLLGALALARRRLS